jgi:hypothetical protein
VVMQTARAVLQWFFSDHQVLLVGVCSRHAPGTAAAGHVALAAGCLDRGLGAAGEGVPCLGDSDGDAAHGLQAGEGREGGGGQARDISKQRLCS